MSELLEEIEQKLTEINTTGYGEITIDIKNGKATIKSTTSKQIIIK